MDTEKIVEHVVERCEEHDDCGWAGAVLSFPRDVIGVTITANHINAPARAFSAHTLTFARALLSMPGLTEAQMLTGKGVGRPLGLFASKARTTRGKKRTSNR